MKPATDQHLYPFTLAFDQGLKDGTVTLDNALEFCNRVFDAYLDAVQVQGGRHAFQLVGLIQSVPRNKEARHSR